MALTRRLATPLLVLLLAAGGSLVPVATATAAPGQLGAPQVVLNPGGGQSPDGLDGIRFVVNSAMGGWSDGQDEVYYRGAPQYCCSAAAPMLNIGGELFGQSGPAYEATAWTSLSVVETTGATVTTASTGSTGSGTATVRYVATRNGLSYTMDRTIEYTYPNQYVTETYAFTIPAGNTDQVKFYQGGDTAPGGSDSGYGISLGEPVRQVISLNTSSRVLLSYSEVSGSKRFDGATSQDFYTPYETVEAGGDIGYVVTPSTHDAGLMVQWNLGSAPGTQTASMRTTASDQGANLEAAFDRTVALAGEVVSLDISVANTKLESQGGLGFALALPAGLSVAAGSPTNSCAGALAASPGATSVALSGGSVAATANCVVSVPVAASTPGSYTISAESATGLANVRNTVGRSTFVIEAPVPPVFEQTTIVELTVGEAVSTRVTTTGRPAPAFAVTAGTLPEGLVLDPATGAITGTPTEGGAYSFSVTATNIAGGATQVFTGDVARGTTTLVAGDSVAAAYGEPASIGIDLPEGLTGSVDIEANGELLCSVTLPARSCLLPADLPIGEYTTTLSYSGDESWNPIEAEGPTIVVSQAGTVVTGPPTTAVYGAEIPVVVSVEPVGDPETPRGDAAAPTGTVLVEIEGAGDCEIALPATSCAIEGGVVPGDYPVALTYSGDANHTGAEGAGGTLTVVPAPTEIEAPAEVSTGFGASIAVPITGLPEDARGTVSVYLREPEIQPRAMAAAVAAPALCTVELPATECLVEFDPPLDPGEYRLAVEYSGDERYEPSSSTVSLTVETVPTEVAAPPAADVEFGKPTTLTATGLPEDATGTIIVSGGGEVLCSITLPATSCEVELDFEPGDYVITFAYGGDDFYAASVSEMELTVAAIPSSIVISEAGGVVAGDETAIGVAVSPADATGAVTLRTEDGVELCTVVLPETRCSFAAPAQPGTYVVTASYSGNTRYAASEEAFVLVVLPPVVVPPVLVITPPVTVPPGMLPESIVPAAVVPPLVVATPPALVRVAEMLPMTGAGGLLVSLATMGALLLGVGGSMILVSRTAGRRRRA